MTTVSFSGARQTYAFAIEAGGTRVTGGGVDTLVPFGAQMSFAGAIKYSKDTLHIVQNVTSHIEAYTPWETLVDLPVNYLRTSYYADIRNGIPILPDRADKVIVAYVNSSEFGAVGAWDTSFNLAWDKNGDYRIDPDVTGLPAYVDRDVFNADWNNYVAKYWDPSWLEEVKKKVDLVASEHFDGIMLDVMTPYWTWLNANKGVTEAFLKQEVVNLFTKISAYAKGKYGEAFIVSANIDPEAAGYFPTLPDVIDVGYYQNAFLEWTGSGVPISYGAGSRALAGDPSRLDFLTSKGIDVLTMDHLGTGPRGPGYEHFQDFDARATPEAFLSFLLKAHATGVTPYLAPLLFGSPYTLVPRFARTDAQGAHSGTSYVDYVLGSSGHDSIGGGAAGDVLLGGAGNDSLDGGVGVDSAVFVGAAADYGWTLQTDGRWRVEDRRTTASEGVDLLTSIEKLVFSDRTVTVGADLPAAVASAANNILRSHTSQANVLATAVDLSSKIAAGTMTASGAIAEIVKAADATTSVATLAYQFFTGGIPGQGGMDYLVSPTGPNTANLNSAYYQSFNLENRYINFASNLGREGEGKAKFLADYGSLTLAQATKKAYGVIFGGEPTDAKVALLLSGGRDLYFESYGKDGLNGQGTKAAMVGWLLAEAVKADIGMYARANDAFLMDLADGAIFGVDLIGVYGKPEFNYLGP